MAGPAGQPRLTWTTRTIRPAGRRRLWQSWRGAIRPTGRRLLTTCTCVWHRRPTGRALLHRSSLLHCLSPGSREAPVATGTLAVLACVARCPTGQAWLRLFMARPTGRAQSGTLDFPPPPALWRRCVGRPTGRVCGMVWHSGPTGPLAPPPPALRRGVHLRPTGRSSRRRCLTLAAHGLLGMSSLTRLLGSGELPALVARALRLRPVAAQAGASVAHLR